MGDTSLRHRDRVVNAIPRSGAPISSSKSTGRGLITAVSRTQRGMGRFIDVLRGTLWQHNEKTGNIGKRRVQRTTSMKVQEKSTYRRFVWSMVFLCTALVPPQEASGEKLDFLVPGVSLDMVSFEAGTRVSYLIIAEAYGEKDSSVVELAVLDLEENDVVLEIASSPYPAREEETITVRLRIAEKIKTITSPEEFYTHLKEILVQEGRESFRSPTADEIEDFELEKMFLPDGEQMERNILHPEKLETPAGTFTCEKVELTRSEARPVSLGGVQAERMEEEKSVLWLSTDIPFWGLVRSMVERKTATKILMPGRQREVEPRTTVTESVLISFERRNK